MKQKKIYPNGTPYSDEQWKNWYAYKSNKELTIEEEEYSKIDENQELKPDQQEIIMKDYKIGQHIKSYNDNIAPYGRIVKITDNPHKGIYQLKLHTGWCVHPEDKGYGKNRDRVEILTECNCGAMCVIKNL